MNNDIVDSVKHGADVLSVGVMLASLAQWLPSVAALFTIIWTAIRIWESATVQKLLGRSVEGG
jgi:peptidoglycan biosynthesis protein MviN/MurJ (putative lipid II flippase)